MKKFIYFLLVVFIIDYIWYVHFDYRFEIITPNKVYKSALINPNKLEDFLVEHKIKTVIDLLDPGIQDALNPAKQKEVDDEDAAIKKINEKHGTNIKHVHIPSQQVPTKKTLTKFFKTLDDPDAYPVLIHCYHGTGRAEIYSALYRVEYENWKNEDARDKTRPIIEFLGYRSSFADGKEKGDFLMTYKPRFMGKDSTIKNLGK